MSKQLQKKLKGVINTVNDQFSATQMPTGKANVFPANTNSPGFYPVYYYNGQPYQNSYNYTYQPYPTYIQAPVPNAPPPYAPPYPPHPYSHPYPPPHPYPCPYPYPAARFSHNPPTAVVQTQHISPPAVQPLACRPVNSDGLCSQACGPAVKAPGSGKESAEGAAAGEEEGNELLHISSGVQHFIVDAIGQVSSPFPPGYLRIITFSNQDQDSTDENRLVLLDVCDQLYLLTRDTPVLLASSGIFMFPEPEASDSFVGIVLSSQLPAKEHEFFEDILSQLVNLQIQSPEDAEEKCINLNEKVPLASSNEDQKKEKARRPKWSEKAGNAILSGATKFSDGFAKTAKSTSKSIHKQGAKIRDNIEPEKSPTKVSPQVTQGLNVAVTTSAGALKVSRFMVDGMTAVSEKAGKALAPQVKNYGPKLVPKSLKESSDGRPSKANGAKFVAARSAQGVSTVWNSLKTGAKDVCKSFASETTSTVEYKYGENAGQATDKAFKAAGNVGLAAYNFNHLTVDKLVFYTAKSTAKEMIEDEDRQPRES